MARLRWAKPALEDLDAIAEYIALDDLSAARRLVARVFDRVERNTVHILHVMRSERLLRSFLIEKRDRQK